MSQQDPDREQPQIYLITPNEFEQSDFAPQLSSILDAVDIACVRLAMTSQDETTLLRAGDQIREIAHARDIPVIIDTHYKLVDQLGLDGVHLNDGARSVRFTRKELREDAVIGAYCAASRHEGLNAGEIGADYIAFGPVTETNLGDGSLAETETFEWWSQMIELPVVAEGMLTQEAVERLTPYTDFFAIGPEIWGHDDPLKALKTLTAALS